jgi:hypothetical protein
VSDSQTGGGWRVKAGLAVFAASLGWPVLVPVLLWLGTPGPTVAAFSGVMALAAEILLVVAAALAGKEGLALIKSRVFGFLKDIGPPAEVGQTRYAVGLVLFALPLLLGWVSPYLGPHMPGFDEHSLAFAVVGDVMLLVSLFVLGGEFWDKLRALFVHGARAVFP